ncbi:MAG: class I SAM-dependent methyltransferase [Candidatus Omnitrophica bacterium]|nr:class I SAM-dependent methyltransferase [Candidatus Omnitrophota bacterium]
MRNKRDSKDKRKVTKRWFGAWSNEYDNTLGKIEFHRKLLDLIIALSGVKRSDKVLDIGCGTGLLSLRFLRAADCRITGIDNSKEMLAIFKDKIRRLGLENRIKCETMDASCPSFEENAFDIIASTVTLHHLKDKHKPLKKIYRALKPGGKLLIGDIDMDTTGRHTDIKRLKRILEVLKYEWIYALRDAGIPAFIRMFDNGKKHIFNEGEYCLGFKQWADLCKAAGFKRVTVKPVKGHEKFKVLTAVKTP